MMATFGRDRNSRFGCAGCTRTILRGMSARGEAKGLALIAGLTAVLLLMTLTGSLAGPFNSWDRQPFLTTVAHGT